MQWKKALAVLCIPIWLFFAFWLLRTVWALIVAGPEGESALAIYLIVGALITLFFWLLFFLGRWIWRVLFQRKKTVKLEWPE
ncbi:MAG: hypothetical protein H6591_06435 [Flavobacteriales bacterium]|nr:hypothetical protein [Flavobacteriales bacterium]